ncbi:phage portal protein [Stutzerimonas nitrititolerans]|uniref:phage portal protein n=1 Tax=Stutzerimonas nitrititolerans TaxID=2482751 RepID=UPI00289E70C8|nr:phage portal protein [Stutzerimonas nitrititolerans]
MRIFGLQVPFTGKQEKALSPASGGSGWWPMIREPFTGAWQRNMEERVDTLIQYPTLYACVARIAQDIGKLPFLIKARQSSGIWVEVTVDAINRVLRKPNHYQTHQQFREAWQLSKLTQGNTYALKERNSRGAVVALYILDPMRVMPMVSDSGEVFYQLYVDKLNMLGEEQEMIVAASEIIHDRCICPFHPLIGLPPIAAANWPALKNMRILRSSAEFFGNGAQPSGILSAPGAISDETAKRLSSYWNDNFTGKNSGKVAVVGDNLKFESLSAKSVDAQMVEQLRYSDEQICQPFGIPPFKVGIGSIPAGLKVDDINQLYYSDALQASIEAMETLLDEGLSVPDRHGIELDLWPLLRMDMQKQAEVEGALVKGSIKKIDEARKNFDLPPVDGGDSIYMQQQNYSLSALARRDAQPDPFNPGSTADPDEPVEPTEEEINDQARMLAILIEKEMTSAEHA